jgi:hypothetical protein
VGNGIPVTRAVTDHCDNMATPYLVELPHRLASLFSIANMFGYI